MEIVNTLLPIVSVSICRNNLCRQIIHIVISTSPLQYIFAADPATLIRKLYKYLTLEVFEYKPSSILVSPLYSISIYYFHLQYHNNEKCLNL